MKHILVLILSISMIKPNCTGQNQIDPFVKQNYTIHNDSIMVKNTPSFFRFKYTGDQYKEQDAVKFRLEVTNKGNFAIPDIQTARWQGGIRIFINGFDAMEMSLANFTFGGEKLIPTHSTDHFDFDLQITGPDAIDFGPVFTWQWEYMGILSSIMQVDISKGTIHDVDKHFKSDKRIY